LNATLHELRRFAEQRRLEGRAATTAPALQVDPQAERRAQLEAARAISRRQDADIAASARRLLEWLEIERNAPAGTLASVAYWVHWAKTAVFEADVLIKGRRHG
jgi:hypothetical protein